MPALVKAASMASRVARRGCAPPRSKSLIARLEAPQCAERSLCVHSKSWRAAAHWFLLNPAIFSTLGAHYERMRS